MYKQKPKEWQLLTNEQLKKLPANQLDLYVSQFKRVEEFDKDGQPLSSTRMRLPENEHLNKYIRNLEGDQLDNYIERYTAKKVVDAS